MYVLRGNFAQKGFYLQKAEQTVFRTQHRYGMLINSTVTLNGDNISIESQNLTCDKFKIFKNNDETGFLDFSYYRYAVIGLSRRDGLEDIFKLEEEGYSQVYTVSQSNFPVLKLDASINPFLFDDEFTIEVISEDYSREAIEELIFYAGEILYRKFNL